MKVSTSIDINAPVEKVFEVFCDLQNADKNISGIKKIEILKGSSTMEVGSRWKETRVMFGQEAVEEMEVIQLEKNASYIVEAESHGTYYLTTFNFKENNGVTNVEMIFDGKAKSLFAKLMAPLMFFMKGSVKKALHQDLIDLKSAIESK